MSVLFSAKNMYLYFYAFTVISSISLTIKQYNFIISASCLTIKPLYVIVQEMLTLLNLKIEF